MLGNSHYYRSSIRNYVIAFGSIFNDIDIQRTNSSGVVVTNLRVPISYGPTEKYLSRINKVTTSGNPAIVLPRMSFEISGFNYAADRKLPKTQKMTKHVSSFGDTNRKNFVFNPVPYDIGFNLSILARNADDAMQIIEQILPFFTPSFIIPIKEANELDIVRDTPLTLESVEYQDDYEGDYISRRALIWNLGFTLNGYFYSQPTRQNIIRTSIANTKDIVDPTQSFQRHTVTTNPADAFENDNFEFVTTFEEDFIGDS